MTSLEGKVVLIVGASSGIGEGIARAFAKESATLVLAARRVEKCEEILKSLNLPAGSKASLAVKVDASKRAEVQKMYEDLEAKHGAVPDVVINCAGCMYFTLLKNQHFDEWEQQIDVNCKGIVNSCGAVLPGMLKRKTGHIVNISSDAAFQTFPALTVYNATKAFVHEFTKGLRCECVGTGIRVTEIAPGDVRTDLIKNNTDQEAAAKIGVSIGVKIGGDDFTDDSPDRSNYLDPQDIADAILYAVKAKSHVGVHQMLIEPRDQMFGDPTSTNSA